MVNSSVTEIKEYLRRKSERVNTELEYQVISCLLTDDGEIEIATLERGEKFIHLISAHALDGRVYRTFTFDEYIEHVLNTQ